MKSMIKITSKSWISQTTRMIHVIITAHKTNWFHILGKIPIITKPSFQNNSPKMPIMTHLPMVVPLLYNPSQNHSRTLWPSRRSMFLIRFICLLSSNKGTMHHTLIKVIELNFQFQMHCFLHWYQREMKLKMWKHKILWDSKIK